MIIYIDTIKDNKISIILEKNGKIVAMKSASAQYAKGEKLLALIDKILSNNNLSHKKLKKVIINNLGGSFTSLRIGATIANALGYALNIPVEGLAVNKKIKSQIKEFDIVKPIYNREPSITSKK